MANEIATWLNKGYAEKLVKAATGYWDQSRDYVMWAVNQKDESKNEEQSEEQSEEKSEE